MKESYQLYRYEDVMNSQRQAEVVLRYYLREKADYGELKSGKIRGRNGQVRYKINEEENDYLIESEIRLPKVTYVINMTIDKSTLAVTDFEYV